MSEHGNSVQAARPPVPRDVDKMDTAPIHVSRQGWPEPEPFPLDVGSDAWRYACLYAIADVYGLELVQDAEGGFTLTCPATAPLDAKRAALDGLHELTPYIVERLLQREEPPQLGQIRCTGCGRHFTPANPNMAYCSVACSNHARRRS